MWTHAMWWKWELLYICNLSLEPTRRGPVWSKSNKEWFYFLCLSFCGHCLATAKKVKKQKLQLSCIFTSLWLQLMKHKALVFLQQLTEKLFFAWSKSCGFVLIWLRVCCGQPIFAFVDHVGVVVMTKLVSLCFTVPLFILAS